MIRACQVPEYESFKNRIAEKAHAFEAVVGEAGRRRDIGGRHRDTKGGLGECRLLRPKKRNQGGGGAGNPGKSHLHHLCHESVTRFRCKLRTKKRSLTS